MKEQGKEKFFHGIFAPVTTPFDANGVCYGALADNISAYNQTDLTGYMPLGSNGEYLGLTEEESLKILALTVRKKAPGKIVVAGCGRESSHATLEFIRRAHDVGLEYAFVLTPHYYADFMTDEAFCAYYLDIADHSPVPLVLYSAPKFSAGLSVSKELMRALCGHENIAGLKNSSHAVAVADYMSALPAGADFFLLAGNITMLLDGLGSGAAGGVLSTATWLPEYCCEIYRLYRSGAILAARAMFEYVRALSCATAGAYGVAGVKYGLELRGLNGGVLRKPLMEMGSRQKEEMAQRVREAGVPSFPCAHTRLAKAAGSDGMKRFE